MELFTRERLLIISCKVMEVFSILMVNITKETLPIAYWKGMALYNFKMDHN